MGNDVIGGNHERPAITLTSGQEVSMQLLQQVYKDITERSETLSKDYDVNHQVKFEDIEQLNCKVEHLLEQYNVVEKNCFVTFYHVDDSRESFSSFDRSRAYEAASLSPTESIRIEYIFLIVLPIAKKPQQYKISIEIQSRAGIIFKSKKETGMTERVLEIMSAKTGYLSIEYIDYAVARTLMHAIDQWFTGLPATPKNKILVHAKKFSGEASFLLHGLAIAVSSLSLINYFHPLIDGMTPGKILVAGIASYALIMLAASLSAKVGYFISKSIGNSFEISYIDLNRGDQKVIGSLKRSNVWAYVKATAGIFFAVLINIFSAWAGKIFNL